MRDYSLEMNLRTLLKRTERMESSMCGIADSVAKNHEANMWTGVAVAGLSLRVDEIGRVLNAWESSQEVRTGMSHVYQTAVFFTTLSFAVYSIGIALANSDMRMLGTLGLFPSMILMAVYFFQVQRHVKHVTDMAQILTDETHPH